MRRHLWVQAPLHVSIDGIDYHCAEWSLGGLAIDQAPAHLMRVGQAVTLRMDLPFQGFDICFNARGEIESRDPTSQRAVIGFRDLGQRERDLLSHFIDQLVRGNMVPIDETIQRLDAPMAAADFAATQAPSTQLRASGWRPARTGLMTAGYGLAGLAALGYLGTLLYSNLFWLEASSSSISAPVANLVSLGDGAVTWVNFKPGDAVKAGDVVLKIADNVLEREIEQAEISVRERENKLAFLARRLESERKRFGALTGLSNLKSAHANAEIEALNANLQSAMRELRQLPSTAVGPLAQVRQRIVSLRQAITLKEKEASGRANLTKETNGSLEIVGQSVVGDLDNLAAQIELAEADIVIASQRHQSYLNQRDRLSLRAPFDGVLRQLPAADSATVRKGDVAAIVERSAEREVTAFLRQDQLLKVQLGASAIVHVPATRQSFTATVTEINPANAQAKEQTHTGSPQGNGGRSDTSMARVRLVLAGTTRPDDMSIYRDGLPAVTMIGLSRVRLPGAGQQPTRAAGTPTPATFAANAAAEATSTAAGQSWFSRNIGGVWTYWSKAARPAAKLGS